MVPQWANEQLAGGSSASATRVTPLRPEPVGSGLAVTSGQASGLARGFLSRPATPGTASDVPGSASTISGSMSGPVAAPTPAGLSSSAAASWGQQPSPPSRKRTAQPELAREGFEVEDEEEPAVGQAPAASPSTTQVRSRRARVNA